MNHCSNCGQDFEGNFCPNCGKVADGALKCPKCGTEITGNFCPNCGYSVHEVKPAVAETRRKSIDLSKITGSAAFVFVKKHWALLLVAVLLLVAFLTLMITLVGLRGIYVNVNNPNDFYDFDATSYRASTIDFLTDKDTLEEGKWKMSGGKLVLTINDELFGKMSDDYDFEKVDGYKRVKIDDVEYKRVSLVGLKTTKKKLKVTFDSQDSGTPTVQKVQISKRLPELEKFKIEDPEYGDYGFLGWYSEPDGKGSSYNAYVGDRMWEDTTFYAYWCKEHVSETYEHDDNYHWQICDNCGKQFGKRNHTIEWIVTKHLTCVLDGTEAYQCKCGYKDAQFNTRSVAATGHTLGEWIEDNAASCTKKAHHHKECANCDHREDEDYGNLLPHEMSDWIIDGEYKCEDTVTRHKDCSNCDYQEIDENYVVPHELGDWIIDGENVCNKDNTPVPRHKECANCDYQLIDNNYVVPHQMGEWIEDNAASCTKKAHHHKECANCDYIENDEDYGEKLPHNFDVNSKKCTVCNSSDFVTGDKLYFGEYPQTKVTDDGITATLAQMSGNRPSKGNSGDWTDYGYYISGSTSEYMWYIDLTYQGERYRGVYFTSYRPEFTTNSSSTGSTEQDDHGYYINTLYWFKWEPIEWRVLEKGNGEAFLMSNVILDSQQYYNNYNNRDISGKTVYPNNYKESDIRAWLNNKFYNWAFDELEQSIIKTTLVDNSANTTTLSSSNSYACDNTNDKVFLLSFKDVLNTSYGFNSDYEAYDTARRLKTTGYAQSQGASTSSGSNYRDNGWWWLRSPNRYERDDASGVYGNGDADFGGDVRQTELGVVPAIKIQL